LAARGSKGMGSVRRSASAAVLAVVSICFLFPLGAAAQARGLALVGGTLIDGTGGEPNRPWLERDFEYLASPRNFVGLPPELELDVRNALDTFKPPAVPATLMPTLKRKLQQLRELGVVFVSGSDEGTFGQPAGDALWRDLEAWVRDFNMDPMTAIKWVTGDAAACMGAGESVGTIRQGKYADIIGVEGNPLEHISVLRAPALVVRHGQRVSAL